MVGCFELVVGFGCLLFIAACFLVGFVYSWRLLGLEVCCFVVLTS